MQNHKFVFIAGLHRSGTSILFQCLREHPLISGFSNTRVSKDEGQHLQSVYRPAKAYGGWGKFGFNPEAHLTELSPLVTEENRIRLFSEWAKYWDTEKPLLLEKSPPNLIRTRFLQALFPDSYFIVLVRHPIAVSYATGKKLIIKSTLERLLNHWLICHDTFSADREHIRNIFVLKYEDFIEDTDRCLEKISSFLGIDSHPNNLRVRSNANEKYFKRWKRLRNNLILKFYANYIIEKYETRVNQYGYSLIT
ncbi:MAG: sulfotransferase [Candidatus Hodarchaeota archaeon]